jgi:polyhydroxyalkanoate synthesis repressor PhaR
LTRRVVASYARKRRPLVDIGRDPKGSAEGGRLIKRYANRKLYDTRESRYVTLHQIAGLVRAGEDVRIIDNTTKEDLTTVTLAQIIVEEEKKGQGGLHMASVGTLRSFIIQGRERLMTSLRDGPVRKLVARREDDAPDEEAAERAARQSAPREGRRSVISFPREVFDDLQRVADERVRALLGGALGHVQQLQAEVRRLQSRIEELEERLVKLSRRAGKAEAPREASKGEAPED